MNYKLKELIDIDHFQNLQDRFNKILPFPSSIIDNDGNILTATAWQDVCTKFHRKNKKCEQACIKSDQYILDHLHEANHAVTYRCPHGLVDNATPIIIEGIHYGNFFTGQFFLEAPDLDFFRAQAKRYGFDEESYIEAVKKVPIWTQEQLNNYLLCIKDLISIIAESGLKGLKEITARRLIESHKKRYQSILNTAMDGFWLTDTHGKLLEVNPTYCQMSGYSEQELLTMTIADIEALEDGPDVATHAQNIVALGQDRFQSRHRRKDGTVFDVEVSVIYSPEGDGWFLTFLRDITERNLAQATLRESEEKYRKLVHTAPYGIQLTDVNGKIVFSNPAHHRIQGYADGELIGKFIWDLMADEAHKSGAKTYYEKLIREQIAPDVYFNKDRTKDGREIDVQVNWDYVLDAKGDVEGIISVISDITQIKQSEKILKLYETIVSSASEPMAVIGRNYQFLLTNGSYQRFWGLRSEDLIGKKVEDIIGKAAFDNKVRPQVDRCLAGESVKYSAWFPSPSLGPRYMNLNYYPFRNETGQVAGLINISYDFTEQKNAEEALRQSEDKFRALVESSPMSILMLRQGKYIFGNPASARMLGYASPEQLVGLDAMTTIAPEFHEIVRQRMQRIEVGEGNSPIEIRVLKLNGDSVWVISTSVSVQVDGQQTAILVGQDITERKQLEARIQQAQRLESIGTLAGGIAHDFNNILGAILGYAEMVQEDSPAGSSMRKDIGQVVKASLRAKDLVKQILTFSRQVEDRKIPMQPSLIVKEAIILLRSSLPTTITINQDIDAEVGMVLADPTKIHQVVMNLATNAFHAMEVKGGVLTISLQKKILYQEDLAAIPDLKPGAFVQLSIKDSGEGIPLEIQEKIFDPFFTTKEVGKGTGLGLSMVYSIVKGCHGAIACDSRVGEGTEFRILLPVREGHAEEEAHSTALIPHGKEHILLIDDEEMLAELGQAMLERLGYHVTTRGNSLDALTTFQNQPDTFDLIITDQTMPGMTGVDLAQRILQIRPQMPIILCTGYSSLISEDKSKAAGIKGFAYKPLAKKDIGVLIRKILDEKNS